MLLIDVELRLIELKSWGIFAKEIIPKGTKIWERSILDKDIHVGWMERLSKRESEYIMKYGYLEGEYWILCIDNAKFMNHSKGANTYNTSEGTYTLKDIRVGEEITTDYYKICDFVDKHGFGFEEK